jgi:hypothetical protein
MTVERIARFERVLERHDPHPDWSRDAVDPLERYIAVARDDSWAESGYHLTAHAELNDALAYLADDVFEWSPYALYDLDTGKSLPLNVSVRVTISDDPGACLMGDLDEQEG